MTIIRNPFFFLLIAGLPVIGRAQALICPDPGTDVEQNKAEARRYFELGTTYFNLNRFDKSAEAFACVIKLVPYTVTARYRLAVSYDRLGKLESAMEQYQWVLVSTSKETEPIKAEVKKRLDELRKQEEEKVAAAKAGADRKAKEDARRKAEAGASTDPPAPGSTPRLPSRWWFWTGLGATVLFAGATAAMGGLAIQEKKDYEKNPFADADAKTRYENYLLGGDLALGGTLLSAAALGVALWLWKPEKRPADATAGVRLVPACGAEGCGLTLSVGF